MLPLYSIHVCFYFYILLIHFSKVILTTAEVITATIESYLSNYNYKSDPDHRRSDYNTK